MTPAERYLLVVCDAKADRETARALARRVLREEHHWLDGLLGDAPGPDGKPVDILPWRGVRETEQFLKWLDVPKEAERLRNKVKVHGHFGGEPGAPGAHAARKALLMASAIDPRPAAVVLVHDLDDQPEWARGFDQARKVSAWPFAVVLALAEPMRECWVLAAFTPENDAERQALVGLRQQIGYDPCENAHKLKAKDRTAVHSPKRVVSTLLRGDAEREARCLREARLEMLERRGEHSGLKNYLDEVREYLAPVYLSGGDGEAVLSTASSSSDGGVTGGRPAVGSVRAARRGRGLVGSKEQFKEALALVRAGRLDEALAIVRRLDLGFVLRRMRHYKEQPDHRESALRLDAAFAASRQAGGEAEPTPAVFEAPLPPAFVQSAPDGAVGFDRPEPFLTWVSADWDGIPALDFGRLYYLDPWALVALGALCLEGRTRRPPLQRGGPGGAVRFARAFGLDALTSGREPAADEPGRTVRLDRVCKPGEIEPMAERMASLVISDPRSEDMRLVIRYVLVELFRNVVQHSRDPLGAVAAAQLMGPARHRSRPMIQLAVADAGIGIPRSLHRAHPFMTDYRQALERALLPHISGTFEEGLTGSLENAGLGLYMISEMARQTGGRLLIATTGAALVLQSVGGETASPRFLQPPGTGFPGTLVAFEIPTDAVQDYRALINSILHKARERTPKRVADRWLSFTPAVEPSAERIALWPMRENTPEASEAARTRIRPALLDGRPVELDFARIDLCTQSWLHALLFEPIRLAWGMRVPIHVVNADPAVREGLRFLEAYALGG